MRVPGVCVCVCVCVCCRVCWVCVFVWHVSVCRGWCVIGCGERVVCCMLCDIQCVSMYVFGIVWLLLRLHVIMSCCVFCAFFCCVFVVYSCACVRFF